MEAEDASLPSSVKTEKSSELKKWIDRQYRRVCQSKDAVTLVKVAVSVLTGIAVLWIVRGLIGASGDAVNVTALLLPLLVFALLTGRISKLKAGGLEAEFHKIAEKHVWHQSLSTVVIGADPIRKGSLRDLDLALLTSREPSPVILLILDVSRPRDYDYRTLTDYLDQLDRMRRFLFVVFLGHDGRLLGYMNPGILRVALDRENLNAPPSNMRDNSILQVLNSGDEFQVLNKFRNVLIQEVIPHTFTVAQALGRLVDLGLSAMLVEFNASNPRIEVVERDHLVSRLLVDVLETMDQDT